MLANNPLLVKGMENQNLTAAKLPDKNLQIRIADIVLFVQKYSLIIILVAFISAALGFAYSYTIEKTFRAKTLLLPEYSMGGNSFFSAMNSQASDGAEKLTPDLYPTVLKSSNFGMYLLKQPVIDQNNKSFPTLKAFFDQGVKPGFFSSSKPSEKAPVKSKAPIKLPNPDILSLSSEEEGAIGSAVSLVSVSVEKKDGIITIESEMTDPVVATQLVEAGKKYLVQYVEDYRTAKTQGQAEFLESRAKEARKRQQNAEYALQNYRDHNRNTFLNVARIEEQRLQSDYTLAQSIYADLVQRLEQANIKVKQEKPVFKVLEPAKIPFNKSNPKRLFIAVIFGVVGGFISLLYILFFKEKIHHHFF